jgi:hypothetical protein
MREIYSLTRSSEFQAGSSILILPVFATKGALALHQSETTAEIRLTDCNESSIELVIPALKWYYI